MNITFDTLKCRMGLHNWKRINIHLIDALTDEVSYVEAYECQRKECGKINLDYTPEIKSEKEQSQFQEPWEPHPVHMYKSELAEKRVDK